MKATELQINSFLQTLNVQFVIPVYQRNYDFSLGFTIGKQIIQVVRCSNFNGTGNKEKIVTSMKSILQ